MTAKGPKELLNTEPPPPICNPSKFVLICGSLSLFGGAHDGTMGERLWRSIYAMDHAAWRFVCCCLCLFLVGAVRLFERAEDF